MAEDGKPEMTPEQAQAVASALFKWTPFCFPLAWALTAVQGADTRTCLIVSVAGTLMCLCAALLFKLRGNAAVSDAAWIQTILNVLSGLKR
jgi:hypothetical protein